MAIDRTSRFRTLTSPYKCVHGCSCFCKRQRLWWCAVVVAPSLRVLRSRWRSCTFCCLVFCCVVLSCVAFCCVALCCAGRGSALRTPWDALSLAVVLWRSRLLRRVGLCICCVVCLCPCSFLLALALPFFFSLVLHVACCGVCVCVSVRIIVLSCLSLFISAGTPSCSSSTKCSRPP